MRAVITTLAPSLGEEGTKTIKDLKRKMVLMEKENIRMKKKKKKNFTEDSPKAFQNRKDFEVVFQITIDDLKQLILMKDEAIHNFVMEINKTKNIYYILYIIYIIY